MPEFGFSSGFVDDEQRRKAEAARAAAPKIGLGLEPPEPGAPGGGGGVGKGKSEAPAVSGSALSGLGTALAALGGPVGAAIGAALDVAGKAKQISSGGPAALVGAVPALSGGAGPAGAGATAVGDFISDPAGSIAGGASAALGEIPVLGEAADLFEAGVTGGEGGLASALADVSADVPGLSLLTEAIDRGISASGGDITEADARAQERKGVPEDLPEIDLGDTESILEEFGPRLRELPLRAFAALAGVRSGRRPETDLEIAMARAGSMGDLIEQQLQIDKLKEAEAAEELQQFHNEVEFGRRRIALTGEGTPEAAEIRAQMAEKVAEEFDEDRVEFFLNSLTENPGLGQAPLIDRMSPAVKEAVLQSARSGDTSIFAEAFNSDEAKAFRRRADLQHVLNDSTLEDGTVVPGLRTKVTNAIEVFHANPEVRANIFKDGLFDWQEFDKAQDALLPEHDKITIGQYVALAENEDLLFSEFGIVSSATALQQAKAKMSTDQLVRVEEAKAFAEIGALKDKELVAARSQLAGAESTLSALGGMRDSLSEDMFSVFDRFVARGEFIGGAWTGTSFDLLDEKDRNKLVEDLTTFKARTTEVLFGEIGRLQKAAGGGRVSDKDIELMRQRVDDLDFAGVARGKVNPVSLMSQIQLISQDLELVNIGLREDLRTGRFNEVGKRQILREINQIMEDVDLETREVYEGAIEEEVLIGLIMEKRQEAIKDRFGPSASALSFYSGNEIWKLKLNGYGTHF